MVGLTFQSDVSQLEAAIAVLTEQLNEQATALSSDDNLFRSHMERLHKDSERNPKVYSMDSRPVSQHSDGPRFERSIRERGLRSQRQHRRGSGRSSSARGSISPFCGFTALASDEQNRVVVDRLIAGVAAAGGAAGFDVEGAEH